MEETLKKPEAWVTTLLFFLFLFAGAALLLLAPGQDYSELERRYLAEKPKLSRETVASGDYMEELEQYLTDRFPGRGALLAADSMYLQLLGKRDIGGAYIGKDGYLMTKLTDDMLSEDAVTEKLEAVKAFTEMLTAEDIGGTVMLVPSSSLQLRDYLPAGAAVYRQDAYLTQAAELLGGNFLDLRDVLTEPEYYYRTDHHWTTDGAYEAYEAYMERLSLKPERKRRYQEQEVTEEFRGTLYAKVLSPFCQKDTIVAYHKEEALTVTADGNGLPGLYFDGKLSENDAYAYFLGGNYGVLSVSGGCDSEAEGAKRRLLIIKDSQANCFLPFLTGSFGEIHMLDLRYYQGSVKEYLLLNRITDVLVLYGMDGFVEDDNVVRLGQGLSEEIDLAGRYQPKHRGEEPFAKDLAEQLREIAGEDYSLTSYGERTYTENFQNLYGMELEPDLISDGAIAYANGSADEISLLYVYDADAVSAVKRLLENRVERRIRDFTGYMPEELPKLEDARIAVNGHYVLLVIGDNAEEIVRLFLKQEL